MNVGVLSNYMILRNNTLNGWKFEYERNLDVLIWNFIIEHKTSNRKLTLIQIFSLLSVY